MIIKFRCEHCHKEVQAPDEAGGKRGACPFCGGSNYVPDPTAAEEEVPLAPLDEAEERKHAREVQELMEAERHILAETAKEETQPRLSQMDKSDVNARDLHHFVVNYVIDMAKGQLERADTHAMKLAEYGKVGQQAVEDFLTGQALEPALDPFPVKVVQGYLKNLTTRIR